MAAIIKREMSSYFHSAIGFVVLAAFYFFAGIYFWYYCLMYDMASLSNVVSQMLLIIVLLIPIITMKSFSEERRQKTDQALLTAPVSLVEVVAAKFLSSFILYALCNAIFVFFALLIALFTTPDWVIIFSTLLGMLLMGAALIAIDLFISVLTESQAVAAFLSIGIGLFIFLFDSLAELISVDFIKNIIYAMSFSRNFSNFTNGIISLAGVIYFLCVTGFFCFLCVLFLDRRRYH